MDARRVELKELNSSGRVIVHGGEDLPSSYELGHSLGCAIKDATSNTPKPERTPKPRCEPY